MSPIVRRVLTVFVFILSAAVLMLLPPLNDGAQAQQCAVGICKVAPQLPPAGPDVDLVFFNFGLEQGTTSETFDLPANGRCRLFGLDSSNDLQIVEEPLEGWTLADIECSDVLGITTTFIENGVIVSCNTQTETVINCNFVNVRESAIPTLSEWGMISVAVGLVLIGVFFAIRKRKAQAV